MKVAFIVSTFPQLSEPWILNQVTGLLDMGHDVRIFSRAKYPQAKVHQAVIDYDLMERVRYFNIPIKKSAQLIGGVVLAIRSLPGSPANILRALNVIRYGVPVLSLSFVYATLFPLNDEFDIIHCHFGTNGLIGAFLKDIGVTGRLVVSFHGHDVNSYPRTAGRNVYRKLFTNFNAFTANTKFTRDQMVNLGCDEKKIAILPMGIRVDQFKFAEKKLSRGEPVRILSVSRITEKKGHEFGIRALARLAGDGRDFEYVIAGDGPLKAGLEQLAAELGIADRVRFLGEVNQEEVLQLYKDSHIFLMPSVTAANMDREGQAVALQEAQASGLPVLSTYHNGIPEGVLEGESAFLVHERDVGALSERLSFLLDHPEVWPEMGEAGRKFVAGRYDVTSLNRRLVSIYEAVLNDDAPAFRRAGL